MKNFRAKAVIVDMDGTLTDVRSVRHHVVDKPKGEKDYDAFHAGARDCPPNPEVVAWVVDKHDQGHVVLIVSGRSDKWKESTEAWLAEHLPVPFDGPFMRVDGDRRSDVIVKTEIYRYLMRHYDVRAAIDDRPDIVALWQRQGIPVTIVPGWYETGVRNT